MNLRRRYTWNTSLVWNNARTQDVIERSLADPIDQATLITNIAEILGNIIDRIATDDEDRLKLANAYAWEVSK